MTKQWFVARTKTGQEVTASVAVASKGFSVFLPVHKVRRTHARKVQELTRPLFPRYLFVQFDPAADAFGEINFCRGVADRGLIVSVTDHPLRIPDDVIAQIRAHEQAELAKAGLMLTGYKPGDTFQIQRGHAAVTAHYMGEDKGKVMAIVEFMGKGHIQVFEFSEVPLPVLDERAA